jgi:predicted metal-binding protein
MIKTKRNPLRNLVDPASRDEMIKSLRNYARFLFTGINERIDKLDEEEDVNKIMEIKKDILLYILTDFPLSSSECYFCLFNAYDGSEESCENCDYGKVHGLCVFDDNSTFSKLIGEIDRLKDNIEDTYWRGDELENWTNSP